MQQAQPQPTLDLMGPGWDMADIDKTKQGRPLEAKTTGVAVIE
jgi:hypothetical protein